VLNRIRRALSLTRVRNASRSRHRRPSTSATFPTARSSPASVDAPALVLSRPSTSAAAHRFPLTGEDSALVRPYVPAWERRVRTRAVVVAPHLSADAWSALTGGH
jgi:hypothetical protein